MSRKQKHSKGLLVLQVQVFSGYIHPYPFREVKTVSHWRGERPHCHVEEPASIDNITMVMNDAKDTGQNVVIRNGRLTSFYDTPGYCDGDESVIHGSIREAAKEF